MHHSNVAATRIASQERESQLAPAPEQESVQIENSFKALYKLIRSWVGFISSLFDDN
jgi:hypothetical protein